MSFTKEVTDLCMENYTTLINGHIRCSGLSRLTVSPQIQQWPPAKISISFFFFLQHKKEESILKFLWNFKG
jgi:hypothetical protein